MNYDELLIRVQSPIRYLNREINSWHKDPGKASLKAALCFPDLYEIGISHLGHRLLYHILNGRQDILADRAYAPWVDLADLMKKSSLPLQGLESKVPLKDFDLLGFTLPNELCYSNVLFMLDLAGIPLRAEQRMDGDWPIVLGGGPCTSNPEPVADFFDAFFFGEADEAILEIADVIARFKKEGDRKKESLLKELSKIPGVYVPYFYEPQIKDGKLRSVKAAKGAPAKVLRRIVADLDKTFFPVNELVPFAEAVHDRYVVEIARGCTRGCRFCHAGIIYRPYRERSPEKILELVRQGLKSTGYEECSLLSLSAGDYSSIEELIVNLIVEHYPRRVAVSLPSLRVSSLSPVLLEAIKAVRKTGFTIAPEAGTERLRRVLNKQITDEEIFATSEKVLKAGWRSLKFYFMAGLPTETRGDLAGIVKLSRKLGQLTKRVQPSAQLSVSVSAFVPKLNTPFQWEKQAGLAEIGEIQDYLHNELGRGRVRLKMEDPRNSVLEGMFSRGGRELGRVIESAHKKGARFDGWTEHFSMPRWLDACGEHGVSPDDYLREKPDDYVFPNEHLDCGVSLNFMRAERDASRKETITDDCRVAGCIENCGVCDQEKIAPRVSKGLQNKTPAELSELLDRIPIQSETYYRYLVKYRRKGDIRFLGLLENNRMFLRAVRRAGLPMRYSQGFHPLPKISFSPAPPVGIESEAEFVELEIMDRWPADKVQSSLQAALPTGIEIASVEEISLKAPSISQIISLIEYQCSFPEGLKEKFSAEKIAQFESSPTFIIEQRRDKGDRSLDLKPKIKHIRLSNGNNVEFGVIISTGPSAKPQEIVGGVFGLNEEDLSRLRYVRTRVQFRESRPVEYPATAARTRPAGRNRRQE